MLINIPFKHQSAMPETPEMQDAVDDRAVPKNDLGPTKCHHESVCPSSTMERLAHPIGRDKVSHRSLSNTAQQPAALA